MPPFGGPRASTTYLHCDVSYVLRGSRGYGVFQGLLSTCPCTSHTRSHITHFTLLQLPITPPPSQHTSHTSYTQLTSQNPYTEMFIGKPYVYTVDIDNLAELTAALKEIATKPVRPRVWYDIRWHIVHPHALSSEPSSILAVRVHL